MTRCGCEKEQSSQSVHSPGLVGDPEPIVYALVEPDTFLNGSIKALKHDRLRKSEMSVVRARYVDGYNARKLTFGSMVAKNPAREDKGYAWALCEEIRDIRITADNVGAFCVIDDALIDFPSHAHIGYSQIEDKKNERQEARGNLLRLFARRGFLTDWATEPFVQVDADSSSHAQVDLVLQTQDDEDHGVGADIVDLVPPDEQDDTRP